MYGLRINKIETIPELDAISRLWIGFQEAPGGPGIFQSWMWNRLWCEEVLTHDSSMRLSVRLIEGADGTPKAILPFYEQAHAGSMLHMTQFLGHRMSTFNDVLLADPDDRDLAEAIVELLHREAGRRGFIHFRQLVDESAFGRVLADKGIAEPQCPRVWVNNDPAFADPLARLSHSRRKQVRRGEKRLREKGPVEYRACRGENFAEAFDELIALHNLRFLEKRQKTILTGPGLKFLKAATGMLSDLGKSEIFQLRCGDKTVAALLQIIDRDRYYSLQAGFDPAYADCSPVWLLDAEAMRRGFGTLGCSRYELGAAYDSYKYSWKPSTGLNYFANFGARNPITKLLAKSYHHAFRRRLPRFEPAGGIE